MVGASKTPRCCGALLHVSCAFVQLWRRAGRNSVVPVHSGCFVSVRFVVQCRAHASAHVWFAWVNVPVRCVAISLFFSGVPFSLRSFDARCVPFSFRRGDFACAFGLSFASDVTRTRLYGGGENRRVQEFALSSFSKPCLLKNDTHTR